MSVIIAQIVISGIYGKVKSGNYIQYIPKNFDRKHLYSMVYIIIGMFDVSKEK